MRPLYIPLTCFFMVIAFYSCHKSSGTAPYMVNITQSHLWSGSKSKTIDSYGCGTDTFNNNFSDIACSITKVNSNTINVAFVSFLLTYDTTNTAAGTVTYAGGSQNDESAKLVYYYALDSMVFWYSGIAGSEHCGYDDVYHIGYFFYTHH
jgi:hypothetical protein